VRRRARDSTARRLRAWRPRDSAPPPPPFPFPRRADLIFNSDKVHYILDEIIMGGMVLETNIADVLEAIIEMNRLEQSTKQLSIKS
jgi:hypothetical protein